MVTVFLGRQGFAQWLPGPLASLSPTEREQVAEALRDLQEVAGEYREWRASEVGSSEGVDSAPAAPLSHEISVREAADMLRVSDRRVRQLCDEGTIGARKPGWSWLVDRASVELHRRGAA
ncbi:helix-turn-helix domain-containing protein [Blastococcus sp. TF02A-35]|uniref:helix-turn-helix domain-containing protein n=1 Tax=Blastococcus sp. TF02A-35 TaxID=2559612 RepID=UPI001431FA94|nr:helix-turn-helix domain-containing protein [Blastococcus sp. TF02A_35]